MKQSLLKKIIIAVIVILAAAAGWDFFYWKNTPAYAAGEIQQAVQHKDLQLFEERVDLRKVYSSALDDSASMLANDGKPDHRFAAAIIKSLKPQLIDELIRQTELKFQSGDTDPKSITGKAAQTLTAYAGSSALSLTGILNVENNDKGAVANVKLHDKNLNKDFIWKVQLEKDINGNWAATKVLNVKEYLQEREAAGKL